MAIAITLEQYLSNNNIDYKLIKHRHTNASLDSSHSAHVPSDHVLKSVVLINKDREYIMAIVPAASRLSISRLNELTGKEYFLLNELKLKELFPDCDKGAIPAMGEAYGMEILVDDTLLVADPVYIEAGDHRHLIKMSHKQYAQIIANKPHGDIGGKQIGISRLSRRQQRDWRL
jgi:Ala-tRNA(Pro) deacylase